ncbi:hypothetical protein D3C81_2289430 [compost metagenome]
MGCLLARSNREGAKFRALEPAMFGVDTTNHAAGEPDHGHILSQLEWMARIQLFAKRRSLCPGII